MTEKLRVLHFVNQFFAGRGGEEMANIELDAVDGSVGPGIRLDILLGDDAEIATTLVAGDNWVAENEDVAAELLRKAILEFKPDVVVAGPAFNAGRYGLACGLVCKVAQDAGVPAVTSMFEENPGVLTYRSEVLIAGGAEDVKGMEPALAKLAELAVKLGNGVTLGPAESEGYFPRGARKEGRRYASAATRAGDMLMARLTGSPWTTELLIETPDATTPAEPVSDLSNAKIAMMTSGGLVPRGNPDGQVRGGSTRWWKYSIDGLSGLSAEEWESIHRGFFVGITNEEPNYVMPLDVMRQLEDAGGIAEIHPTAISVSGVGTHVSDSIRIGDEMAEYLQAERVDGALLVAT